jgi:hypothetical protein
LRDPKAQPPRPSVVADRRPDLVARPKGPTRWPGMLCAPKSWSPRTAWPRWHGRRGLIDGRVAARRMEKALTCHGKLAGKGGCGRGSLVRPGADEVAELWTGGGSPRRRRRVATGGGWCGLLQCRENENKVMRRSILDMWRRTRRQRRRRRDLCPNRRFQGHAGGGGGQNECGGGRGGIGGLRGGASRIDERQGEGEGVDAAPTAPLRQSREQRENRGGRLGCVGKKEEGRGVWASNAWGSRSIARGGGGRGERRGTGLQRHHQRRFDTWMTREQGKAKAGPGDAAVVGYSSVDHWAGLGTRRMGRAHDK